MTIAHFGHVVTPHPVPGNRTGYAWCERPGRQADTEPLWWEQSEGQASAGARRLTNDCSLERRFPVEAAKQGYFREPNLFLVR